MNIFDDNTRARLDSINIWDAELVPMDNGQDGMVILPNKNNQISKLNDKLMTLTDKVKFEVNYL